MNTIGLRDDIDLDLPIESLSLLHLLKLIKSTFIVVPLIYRASVVKMLHRSQMMQGLT